MIASHHATMHELDTVLGVEDVMDLIEIMNVEAHNRTAWRRHQEREG